MLKNLSFEGCGIHSPQTVLKGNRLTLTIARQHGREIACLSAVVRWTQHPNFGAEFDPGQNAWLLLSSLSLFQGKTLIPVQVAISHVL